MFLNEEHLHIQETVRRFADEVIRPVAAELDEQERFAAEIFEQLVESMRRQTSDDHKDTVVLKNNLALLRITVSDNFIDGNLQCQNNSPPPSGSGNVVMGNIQGQCEGLGF